MSFKQGVNTGGDKWGLIKPFFDPVHKCYPEFLKASSGKLKPVLFPRLPSIAVHLSSLLDIQCEVIRSEQFENGPFSYKQHVYTSSTQKITFARHEYGRVGVFRIKMRSLVQKL